MHFLAFARFDCPICSVCAVTDFLHDYLYCSRLREQFHHLSDTRIKHNLHSKAIFVTHEKINRQTIREATTGTYNIILLSLLSPFQNLFLFLPFSSYFVCLFILGKKIS